MLTRENPCDIGVFHRLHDGSQNWDHLNFIFPVYMKLMAGFPSVHQENIGLELLP
jgi:hypothetical protein